MLNFIVSHLIFYDMLKVEHEILLTVYCVQEWYIINDAKLEIKMFMLKLSIFENMGNWPS